MIKANELKPLDRVRITEHLRDKTRERIFEAIVTCVEEREGFTYFSWVPTKAYERICGTFGTMRIDRPAKQFSADVVILGHNVPVKVIEFWSPKPGDRSYDLMC